MVRQNLRSSSSSSQTASKTNPLIDEDFPSVNLLLHTHTCDSILTAADIPRIKTLLGLGDGVNILIPKPGQKADGYRRGWICLYLYPFNYGLRFPFPQLVQDFLQVNRIPMAQLLPYTWRVLLSTAALNHVLGAEITLGDLAHRFSVRSHGHGQYSFRLNNRCQNFLEMPSRSKDDDWYKKFFYVEIESLGVPADYLFEEWIRTSCEFPFPFAVVAYFCHAHPLTLLPV